MRHTLTSIYVWPSKRALTKIQRPMIQCLICLNFNDYHNIIYGEFLEFLEYIQRIEFCLQINGENYYYYYCQILIVFKKNQSNSNQFK